MTLVRMPVDITWSGAEGSPGVNIWHLRSSGSADPFGDDFDLTSEAIRDFYTAIRTIYPTTVNISFVGELGGVGPDTGDTYTATDWGLDGSTGTNFLPPSQCLLVNWKANTGGRSGRGRTFLGPLSPNTLQENGSPTEAARTLVLDAANDLISTISGLTDGAAGIWSPTDGVLRDFTSADVPNIFAVLRSRRD